MVIIRDFFNSKFNSSLINWCQTELLILKTRVTVFFWKKIVISASNNGRVIFFSKFVEKCQILNTSHGYLIWCILTKLFSFFDTEKDIHFLKAFYNSLIAKNHFVIKCTWECNFWKRKITPVNCCATAQRWRN